MFDPKKMISPFQSVVKAVDSKDPVYRLLIDKYNTIVNKVEHQDRRTNTIATCTQIDSKTGSPFTRQVEYDRLDIGLWAEKNTTEYVDSDGVRRRSLISGGVDKSMVDVDVSVLTSTLYNDHNILISEADLTYGKDKSYSTIDTEFGKAYYLVNCTIYGKVVTYTGGEAIVNHLNVGRTNLLPSDTDIKPALSLVRTNQTGETIELKLPNIGNSDKWTLQIESVRNLADNTNSVLWLKIELSGFGDYWNVYDGTGLIGTFDATIVNTLTISSNESGMVIQGMSTGGESQELQFEPQSPVTDYVLQRVTAYSNNPYATTFQFEMNASTVEEAEAIDVNVVRNNTISAHPLSNALTGRVDAPMTLTDLRAVNYQEVAQHTYRTKATQTFEYGSIDRVALMDNDKMLLVNIKISDLPNLIRSNKISKLVFDSYSLVKNGYEYGTYVYEVRSVDVENETMHLVMTYRGDVIHEDPVAPLPTQDTFEFKISWQYSNVMYNQAMFDLGRPLNDTLQSVNKQQNFKVTVYMKGKQTLPEVVYTKSIAGLIIG